VNATTRGFVSALMTEGRVRRAYLGIAGGSRPLPPKAAGATGRDRGIEILTVVSGSPADRAGLRPEDLLLGVDGSAVANVGDLQRLMTGERIGRPVGVEVFRRGKVQTVQVVPVELPD
jgi:S1-C subfamily serine protease